MKNIFLSKFFFILFICCNGKICGYGQTKFNFSIEFIGPSFDNSNLNINFYKGYEVQSIQPVSFNKIIETETASLNYPVLEFFYRSSKSKIRIYRFFLTKRKSHIKIKYDLVKDDLNIQESFGMLDFSHAGQQKFKELAEKEIINLESFEKKYNYDFSNFDSAQLSHLTKLTEIIREKGFESIKANPRSLYSLWYFMNELLGKPDYSLDYLSRIYKQFLQPHFKNTFENKFILEKLEKERLGINTKAPYQNVSFKDLNGTVRKIKDFNGKPLIVILWATWCVPCVAEIPQLKKLYSNYKGRLELVSFSTDRNENKHKNFVMNNNMDWINVYGRYDLADVYGADKGVPQVYLLDKNGVIVYSRSILNDYNLTKLGVMVDEILK